MGTNQISQLFDGHSSNRINTVFLDSFYDIMPSAYATMKFQENAEKLLNFSTSQPPFECKDIEKAVLELRQQQEIMNELLKAKKDLEVEKNSLIFTIEML